MAVEIFRYKNNSYLPIQKTGNAARFIIPFAKEFCKGTGYDIGYGEEDWKFPGAKGIDIKDNLMFHHANHLPEGKVDYIFSSHLLEHLPDWVTTLDYWLNHLKDFGVLFLYLPDYTQEYWRPWNNRKHKHILTPEILQDFFDDRKVSKRLASGVDFNCSFCFMVEK